MPLKVCENYHAILSCVNAARRFALALAELRATLDDAPAHDLVTAIPDAGLARCDRSLRRIEDDLGATRLSVPDRGRRRLVAVPDLGRHRAAGLVGGRARDELTRSPCSRSRSRSAASPTMTCCVPGSSAIT